MVFSSDVFLFLFLPIVLMVYYLPLIKERRFKNIWLFITSIVFYAWGEPVYVALILLSILVNWYFGKKIVDGVNSKAIVWASIIYNLSFLFVFKYMSFVLSNLGFILNKDWDDLNVILPIGISFYTFQSLSYVIDVYRSKNEGNVDKSSILDVGLYIAFFPQLIAGPIVRYNTIAEEINNRNETWEDFTKGIKRFIFGLAKKILIANNVAVIANIAFESNINSVAMAWLGAICYTIQIYFDFSGYSDMAIGLGKLFGFHFEENFNYPYISKTVTEFWRRWHISLSTWFRDYVYIPLGGNRVSSSRHIINLAIVWLLTGIWHGANWTFVLWGVIYFVVQVLEKKCKYKVKIAFINHMYTMFIVIICWVLFRADTVGIAFEYVGKMFGMNGVKLIDSIFIYYFNNMWIYIVLGIIFSFPTVRYISDIMKSRMNRQVYDILGTFVIVVVFILTLAQVVSSSYNPFIYFNF